MSAASIERLRELATADPGRPLTVFLAGPDDTPEQLAGALSVASQMLSIGYVPFVPQLRLTWRLLRSQSPGEWLRWCATWVDRCDALVRLEGPSEFADLLADFAEASGRPVYESYVAFLEATQGVVG